MHISAKVHARIATFDDEKWKLITLMCSHYAYPANYSAIFAPSCGSIGGFTDIKQFEDGTLAITPQMRNYSFPVQRTNGDSMHMCLPLILNFIAKKPALWCSGIADGLQA